MTNDIKLTSVKVMKSLYDRFKIKTVNSKMTLQKLTNRSIHLYLSDENFRDTLKEKGFLRRDYRVKERKKYGLRKARKAPQYRKR